MPPDLKTMQNNGLAIQNKIRFSLKPHLIVGASYLLLAIILTWPIVAHLTTHLPGDGGDDPAIAWNLWWVKFALLNQGENPFYSTYLFYPIGVNLAFYTLTALNAVTALPFTLNLGVVTASNLHMLFTFVVGGYGAFLLTRYFLITTLITADHSNRRPALPVLAGPGSPVEGSAVDALPWLSAAITGGFYAFAGSKLFYVALGQFNIASSHWVPFAVLYVIRSHHHPHRLKNGLLAGLFLALQAWAEMTYASFLLIFIGLYWLYWLATHLIHRYQPNNVSQSSNLPISQSPNLPISQSLLAHLRSAFVLSLVFILGIAPILAQMLPDMLREGDFLVEGGGFADAFSADLLGFVIPTMHHPWLGHLIMQSGLGQPGSATGFDKGQHIYLGFVLLGLLVVAGVTHLRRPELRFWLLAVVVFGLLTLGPVITLNGQPTNMPGPFVILQQLPFFKGNRYPSRYSVMLLLSLSVLAAFALTQIGHLLQSTRTSAQSPPIRQFAIRNSPFTIRHLILTAIALLFLFEHLSLPLPQSNMRVPPPYQIIAADSGDFTVLDIPFAWRNGFRITGPPTTQFMFGQFYQTTHQKRLLQGNTSRNPALKFQYFTTAPIVNSLLALETGKTLPPERWETDRVIAPEVLRFFDIQYIVVRPEESSNPTVTPQATLPYIEELLPVEKIHDDPTLKIYKVTDKAQDSKVHFGLQIDTDSPLAPLYFGEGWGLLTPGRPLTAQREQTRLLLPFTANVRRVTLQIRLPDAAGVESRAVWLEANGWQSSPQRVTRDWQALTFEMPMQALQPNLTDVWLHFDEVTHLPRLPARDVTVTSAGEAVGDFGHIFINGYDVSPNKRGYNAAIIQPALSTEPTIQAATFDTHLVPAASAQLVNFIRSAPPDAIIALAAADEASATLSEAAVQILQQTTGATGDLRGCFRCSHAIIRQESEPTLEGLNALQPVGLTTNLGLTEPTLAAIVDEIRVEPVTP